jgi:hypothetical protein
MVTTTSLSKLVLTELEVVNKMLSVVDLSPVASITGTLDLEVADAVSRFSDINRNLQALGWDWNIKREVQYLRDVSNNVVLPGNVLAIRVRGTTVGYDLVLRENSMLYDRDPDVQSFALTIDPVLDVTELLMFEDLPQSARNYISLRAVREHERYQSADDTKRDIATDAELRAWSALINDHSYASDETLETNPNVYSSIFGRE